MNHLTNSRRAGVLAHITSLPSQEDLGKMDSNARKFIDWLQETGFSVWQILALGPTHYDRSPYLSLSAFAGNPNLISVKALCEDQALNETWLGPVLRRARYDSFEGIRTGLLSDRADLKISLLPGAAEFLKDNAFWLKDYAEYQTLRFSQGHTSWWTWPDALRDRDSTAVKKVVKQHADIHHGLLVEQYLFDRQWRSLKDYANERGISLFGDIPLYVAHDSVDVWANKRYFALDDDGQPAEVAGVPPDMFSEDGQVWGNPVFNWSQIKNDNFDWWIARIRRQLSLVDLLRIDHFRGLQAYWSIPAGDETAKQGKWIKTPGKELLDAAKTALGNLPLVAEDLGYITEEVDALRTSFEIPSMRVLQFGFDGSQDNPHLKANVEESTVYYTGTHDNDTVVSWFDDLHEDAQRWIREMLRMSPEDAIEDAMVENVLESSAALAILPVQDILGLGAGNRMNMPGTTEGNWIWQFDWNQLGSSVTHKFKKLINQSQRSV